MSHFNFVVPLHRDDLFDTSNSNQYVVDNVYNMRDLKIKLQDMAQSVQQVGANFILFEGFDVLFSLLGEFTKNATPDMKNQGVEIAMKGMVSLVDQLAVFLNNNHQGGMDSDERLKNLNKMKMMLYVFCQMVQKVEGDQSQYDPLTGGKHKGKKKNKDDDFSFDWEVERHRAVTYLYNLVQLNLQNLFEPPIIEEEVLSLMATTLFKILENPNMSLVKCKDVRLSTIQVLGTINKRFNYTLSCSLKFVQQLKHFEHLVTVFSQATEVMVREYGLTGMVMELVREISRVDTKELARDTSGTRAYSQFLVELAEKVPEFIRPSVSLLTAHLDGESYSMRKCVLGVLGEIVAKVLTKEELTEADRDDRDNFLDCLEDHIHDVHAHVRSHVLQIWVKLCANKCIPLSRQHKVLELTTGRLQDKSSNVRKAAVQLLNTLLQSNPFAAKLQTEDLEEKLAEEKVKLSTLEPEEALDPAEQWENILKQVQGALDAPAKDTETVWENAAVGEVMHRIADFLAKGEVGRARGLIASARQHFDKEDIFGGQEDMDQDNDEEEEEEDAKILKIMKEIFLEARKAPEPTMSQSQNNNQEEVNKQRMMVQYLSDSVKFSKIIHKSLPVVAQLLCSKQSTDILEAIEFFVSAFEFGVLNAMLGVRKMLALIWSRESSIKDAVVAAYKRLYINVEAGSSRAAAVAVSRNLIALISTATLGELNSMEVLVAELVNSKDIGKPVFTVLWEYFTGVLPDASPGDSRPAIILLRMCACSEVSIITANVQVIIDHGLSERGEQDYQLVRESCNALIKMVPDKLKQDDPEPPLKYKPEHKLFQRLEALLVEGLYNKLDPHYMPMAKSILRVVYQLCEGPDTLATNVVRQVVGRIQEARTPDEGEVKMGTYILRRLCFLVGEIALNQLNYLDVNVFNELKRRNYLREAKLEKEKKAKKEKKKRASLMRATALGTPMGNVEDEDMGVVGAEADDAEAEFIRSVCEKEILGGEGLLSAFTPLLVNICSNPVKYEDPDLRSSAGVALCKYMLVSSEFADKHLRLIFTMLEKEIAPVIRANLIIALGDLSFRFPNNVEPWTPKMYARLHDMSIKVRSNTLTVLTHLILNDMIKVKGQISDMAFCIVDDIDKISGLAKVFFAELAKKGHTLYNVMPDIVSRLSDPQIGIAEDSFRAIMRYIIGLIEKDKLMESLVEKLCHRFRATRTRRQWRDIAFCLSLFPYSDKSFRKLQENFSCWSDKLHEDFVYDCFQSIFASLKKASSGPSQAANKVEVKQLIEELEGRVEEARAKGVEDDTADRRAKQARSTKDKKNGKKKNKDDDDSEEEDEDETEEDMEEGGDKDTERENQQPQRASRRSQGKLKQKKAEDSESDEEEEEENEQEQSEEDEKEESPKKMRETRKGRESSKSPTKAGKEKERNKEMRKEKETSDKEKEARGKEKEASDKEKEARGKEKERRVQEADDRLADPPRRGSRRSQLASEEDSSSQERGRKEKSQEERVRSRSRRDKEAVDSEEDFQPDDSMRRSRRSKDTPGTPAATPKGKEGRGRR